MTRFHTITPKGTLAAEIDFTACSSRAVEGKDILWRTREPDNPLPVDHVPEGSVATHRVSDGEDFLVRFPTGDVINANDRWTWITEDDGMWAKWKVMPSIASTERTRLVSLSFSDILAQRFDPVVDALMPPGANDED
jgi:hypothetical protein